MSTTTITSRSRSHSHIQPPQTPHSFLPVAGPSSSKLKESNRSSILSPDSPLLQQRYSNQPKNPPVPISPELKQPSSLAPLLLPNAIWIQIASYLPASTVQRLMGVNAAFFELAMDLKYRQVSFAYLDERMVKLVGRLRDPTVARRVRILHIYPGFLKEVHDRTRSRSKSPFSHARKYASSLLYKISDIFSAHSHSHSNPNGPSHISQSHNVTLSTTITSSSRKRSRSHSHTAATTSAASSPPASSGFSFTHNSRTHVSTANTHHQPFNNHTQSKAQSHSDNVTATTIQRPLSKLSLANTEELLGVLLEVLRSLEGVRDYYVTWPDHALRLSTEMREDYGGYGYGSGRGGGYGYSSGSGHSGPGTGYGHSHNRRQGNCACHPATCYALGSQYQPASCSHHSSSLSQSHLHQPQPHPCHHHDRSAGNTPLSPSLAVPFLTSLFSCRTLRKLSLDISLGNVRELVGAGQGVGGGGALGDILGLEELDLCLHVPASACLPDDGAIGCCKCLECNGEGIRGEWGATWDWDWHRDERKAEGSAGVLSDSGLETMKGGRDRVNELGKMKRKEKEDLRGEKLPAWSDDDGDFVRGMGFAGVKSTEGSRWTGRRGSEPLIRIGGGERVGDDERLGGEERCGLKLLKKGGLKSASNLGNLKEGKEDLSFTSVSLGVLPSMMFVAPSAMKSQSLALGGSGLMGSTSPGSSTTRQALCQECHASTSLSPLVTHLLPALSSKNIQRSLKVLGLQVQIQTSEEGSGRCGCSGARASFMGGGEDGSVDDLSASSSCTSIASTASPGYQESLLLSSSPVSTRHPSQVPRIRSCPHHPPNFKPQAEAQQALTPLLSALYLPSLHTLTLNIPIEAPSQQFSTSKSLASFLARHRDGLKEVRLRGREGGMVGVPTMTRGGAEVGGVGVGSSFDGIIDVGHGTEGIVEVEGMEGLVGGGQNEERSSVGSANGSANVSTSTGSGGVGEGAFDGWMREVMRFLEEMAEDDEGGSASEEGLMLKSGLPLPRLTTLDISSALFPVPTALFVVQTLTGMSTKRRAAGFKTFEGSEVGASEVGASGSCLNGGGDCGAKGDAEVGKDEDVQSALRTLSLTGCYWMRDDVERVLNCVAPHVDLKSGSELQCTPRKTSLTTLRMSLHTLTPKLMEAFNVRLGSPEFVDVGLGGVGVSSAIENWKGAGGRHDDEGKGRCRVELIVKCGDARLSIESSMNGGTGSRVLEKKRDSDRERRRTRKVDAAKVVGAHRSRDVKTVHGGLDTPMREVSVGPVSILGAQTPRRVSTSVNASTSSTATRSSRDSKTSVQGRFDANGAASSVASSVEVSL
ncbi:hypothetical protein CVT24_011407 [Panaeolus cyanescens]|uniref:Cytochrome c domain-containing protein n=1 Tax=Panaeolus cyanescens TaxID=181874 RepID=A0A409VG60_9AGAR|nr:hypothetical protein CVT24_011407 [Panaeolus cyanescens]